MQTENLTEEQMLGLLYEANVINEFSHFENSEFSTAITSKEELFTLIKLAFEAGVSTGYY
jgi:hypothetical protein